MLFVGNDSYWLMQKVTYVTEKSRPGIRFNWYWIMSSDLFPLYLGSDLLGFILKQKSLLEVVPEILSLCHSRTDKKKTLSQRFCRNNWNSVSLIYFLLNAQLKTLPWGRKSVCVYSQVCVTYSFQHVHLQSLQTMTWIKNKQGVVKGKLDAVTRRDGWELARKKGHPSPWRT